MSKSEEFDDLEYGMAASSNFAGDFEDFDDSALLDPTVPSPSLSDDQQADHADKDDLPNPKMMIKKLTECGKEMGIQVDKDMINVVLSGASVYEFSDDAMRWFILGVTYMNNKRIIPEFSDMLNSLRSEIKSLQQTNSAIKASSSDITKKMVSVKDEVLTGFEKLRAGVIDKVIEIEEQKKSAQDTGKSDSPGKSAKQGINIVNEHRDNTSSGSVSTQDKVPESKKTENPVLNDKKNILMSLGGNKQLISAMNEEELVLYITDEELAELNFGEHEELREEIRDEILLRLDESELF
nr:TPA_asm: P [Pogostemom alphacytorhabdovirus 3_Lag]